MVAITSLYDYSDASRCKLFATSLRGSAQKWFQELPTNSIATFHDLAKSFLGHFRSKSILQKDTSHLMNIQQRSEESLSKFLNDEVVQIKNIDERILVVAFCSGIKSGNFNAELAKRMQSSYSELLERASEFIRGEESNMIKRELYDTQREKVLKTPNPHEQGTILMSTLHLSMQQGKKFYSKYNIWASWNHPLEWCRPQTKETEQNTPLFIVNTAMIPNHATT
ncbi:hypothetical protein ACH5RR_021712 [Cinchona calisaya]|uniref:Retrotransposon gag domain-containing protein n=1 Tax=Cinchona calisaya TaxID=153742 RepID=A0ABD2ZN17_9GENT